MSTSQIPTLLWLELQRRSPSHSSKYSTHVMINWKLFMWFVGCLKASCLLPSVNERSTDSCHLSIVICQLSSVTCWCQINRWPFARWKMSVKCQHYLYLTVDICQMPLVGFMLQLVVVWCIFICQLLVFNPFLVVIFVEPTTGCYSFYSTFFTQPFFFN